MVQHLDQSISLKVLGIKFSATSRYINIFEMAWEKNLVQRLDQSISLKVLGSKHLLQHLEQSISLKVLGRKI